MKMIKIQSKGKPVFINIKHILTICDYMDKNKNKLFTCLSLIDGTEIDTDELMEDVITKIRAAL